MDIHELEKLKDHLKKIYTEEKKKSDLNNNTIIKEELKDIIKEQIKVDSLIKIYKSNDIDYIVMKLERLYMMLLSGLNESKFNRLDDEELFKIFNKYFPKEWSIKYSIDKKEELLLEAICINKKITELKEEKYGN